MTNQFIRPDKVLKLKEQMKTLGIQEKDIKEKFILSQGKGGQKVNKTASCVYLKHIPTDIEIKCQKSRFREANRFFARRNLCEKILESIGGEKSAQKQKEKKIRQQKKRRFRRSKQKHQPIVTL